MRGIIITGQGCWTVQRRHAKSEPPRSGYSGGVLLCLLALAVTIKPLADVTANYTCYDSHKDAGQNFQYRHPLSVARMGRAAYLV